jgi:hypothetical protein
MRHNLASLHSFAMILYWNEIKNYSPAFLKSYGWMISVLTAQ